MAAINQIQLRRGTATSWETSNPTLTSGEPGFVTDLNRLKIGDGSTPWNDLEYISSEAYSLVTTVFNNTGSSIPKMTAVYINGGHGDQPTVTLAQANAELTSSKTYGVTAEAIANMSTGKVVVAGALIDVNTDQFNPTAPSGNVNGTTLWLSPTVAGGLTTTKPSAPNHMVAIGTIIRTHANEGIVEIRVQNGFELEELHNVAIAGVTGGQFLYYDGSTSLWKHNPNIYSSGSNIGIGTSSPGSTLDVRGSAIFNEAGGNFDFRIEGDTDSNLFFVDASADDIGIGLNTPSSKLHLNATEAPSSQDSIVKLLSTQNTTYGVDTGWVGRTLIGAQNLTFLLGCYNGMAAIGGHSWTNANTQSGAAWSDIYFNPDGSTKIYLGSTSSWTPNQGIMTIDNSTGFVGINTSSPTNLLNIEADASSNSLLKVGSLEFQPYSVNNAWIAENAYLNGSAFVRRQAGAAGLFYFQGTEGQFRFDVSDDAETEITSNPVWKIMSDGSMGVGSGMSSAGGSLTDAKFVVTSDGNVGIKTSTPSTTLDVNGTAIFGANVLGRIKFGEDTFGGELGFYDNNDNTLALRYADGSFRYGGGPPGAANLIVTSSGYVGIGTVSPIVELDVQGTNGAINSNRILTNYLQTLSDYDTSTNSDLTIGDATKLSHINWNIDQNGTATFGGGVNTDSIQGANDSIITVQNLTISDNLVGMIAIDAGANTLSIGTDATVNITSSVDNQINLVGNVDIQGNLVFDSFTESVVTIGNSSTSKTISLASGTVQTCTLTGNCTFTMPTATAGKSFTMFLNTGSGNYTASFSGVRWADSATPTVTILANKVDIYSFISDGSYWYGSFSQNYG